MAYYSLFFWHKMCVTVTVTHILYQKFCTLTKFV